MDEQKLKKELSPDQLIEHQVKKMSNRQMSNRLKRLARADASNIDSVWAIVLNEVFSNTKPVGKMEPFLR